MKYKSDLQYSYALGAFPTFELLKKRPEAAREVLVHPSFELSQHVAELRKLCAECGIAVRDGKHGIQRISPKENVFVVGVFDKFYELPDASRPHVLLDRVADMGNMGTIMRTALGFGFRDVAIVSPSADCFAPRTVRASMGAVFSLRVMAFESLAEYRAAYPSHKLYSFMLDGAPLENVEISRSAQFTLAFGNEGEGLGGEYCDGFPVRIEQSAEVDSLNITVAAAVALHKFRCV